MTQRFPSILDRRCINDGMNSILFFFFSLFLGFLGLIRGRLKQLDEGAFTQKEAEAAIGLSTDKGEVKQSMDSR